MKKLLFLLLIGGLFVAFSSCSKNCTCKEKITGFSYEFTKEELDGFTCKEVQKELNKESEGVLNWTCK